MTIPYLSNKQSQQQQNHRHSFMSNELHAFDLTWRNYLPSASQFCCCFNRNTGIRLEDDDPLIEPPYYNDQTLYRGEALQNYLDNPRDWEFESVLGQNDLPQFVTRNPFGTSSSLKKKKSTKKKKHNRRERPVVMETDVEEGDIAGYDIQDNHDAEYLGDDQIANLAYNRHSSQVMDQYGEELYYQTVHGPIEQEMQAPPSQPPREFYAARTMPNLNLNTMENDEDYAERLDSSSSSNHISTRPLVAAEAAQTLLTDRLDDLTEKLAFIKNNIIQIRPAKPQDSCSQQNDNKFDGTTLQTLNHEEASTAVSDIDSIASEALDLYEHTNNHSTITNNTARRYSSGDELHIPSLVDNTPFASDQHPFSYFTEQSSLPSNQEESQSTNNVQSVLNIGRKWLGV